MPVLLPRNIEPMRTTVLGTPGTLRSVGHSGRVQLRAHAQVGRTWSETWPPLRAGDPDAQRLLAFLDEAWNRALIFEADHLLTPGSGRPHLGVGAENLVRSAGMDTDTSGDGVADDFVSNGAGPFSVTPGAKQTITGDGADSHVFQKIFSIREGDTITFSVDAKNEQEPVFGNALIQIIFQREDNSNIASIVGDFTTNLAFSRLSMTEIAPSETDNILVRCMANVNDPSGSVVVSFRSAHVTHGVNFPLFPDWTNPHVDGGGQTGEDLNTAGWESSTSGVLRAGDFIRIGDQTLMHKVLNDVSSDAAGSATLRLNPLVRTAPFDGDVLRLEQNRFRAIVSGWPDRPQAQALDYYEGLRISYTEVPE